MTHPETGASNIRPPSWHTGSADRGAGLALVCGSWNGSGTSASCSAVHGSGGCAKVVHAHPLLAGQRHAPSLIMCCSVRAVLAPPPGGGGRPGAGVAGPLCRSFCYTNRSPPCRQAGLVPKPRLRVRESGMLLTGGSHDGADAERSYARRYGPNGALGPLFEIRQQSPDPRGRQRPRGQGLQGRSD